MPIFTKESLEQLRNRINLVELLSSHLEMKRAGSAFKALCPFHDEKTPSFIVQNGDTHYHCFGCGAHGDAIQFLMTHVRMSFSEAVESLAERFQVHLEKTEGEKQTGPNKAVLKEVLEQACRFYHYTLLHTQEGHSALQYLYNRGIDLEFIKMFRVGLASFVPNLLKRFLNEKLFKDELLIEAGLLKDSGREFFQDRITFPIHDASNAVIGFSSRKYKEETFGGKYINTPETPLFKKSKVLFGLNYSRKRIAKEQQAIIVEGQIDALRLIQEGFNFTVAGQGTAFGEGHVKELINLGVTRIFLALDGDEAGHQATSKIGDLFQKEGVEVRIVLLPPKMDPDSFLRAYGSEKFGHLLENSTDYIAFQVQFLSKKYAIHSPAGKHQIVQELSSQIRNWNHSVMVHESLRKVAHLTQVPEEIIGIDQNFVPNLYIKKSDSIGLQSIDPDQILESDFLRWLILMGNILPNLLNISKINVRLEDLRNEMSRSVYQMILEKNKEGKHIDLLELTIHSENQKLQTFLTEITQKKINREKAMQHFLETVQKILNRNWMMQREKIKLRLHSGQSSEEEALQLIKQFDELRVNPPQIKIC